MEKGFRGLLRQVQTLISALGEPRKAQEYVLDQIRAGSDALKDVFSEDWASKTDEDRTRAVEDVKRRVVNHLIPLAGSASLAGVPGILVYTPCQVVGGLAIARIRDPNFQWRSPKSPFTIVALLFWGKLGQVTFQTLFALARDFVPAPLIGVAVIPFVQLWTRAALAKVDAHFVACAMGAARSEGTLQDLKASDADLYDVTSSARDLATQILRGRKVLFDAQQQLVSDLVQNGSVLTLGRVHAVSGVAGSGKTVILAQLVPHLMEVFQDEYRREPRILVFHHNNYLRQLLYGEILDALRSARPAARDHAGLLARTVDIHTLRSFQGAGRNCPYDITLIDEGQDIEEGVFDLVFGRSWRIAQDPRPTAYVFYDDFQNIAGVRSTVRQRLNGYEPFDYVLSNCVRSTKRVMDFAVNTVLGPSTKSNQRAAIGDMLGLGPMHDRGMIDLTRRAGNTWHDCRFCVFRGDALPQVHSQFATNAECLGALVCEIGSIMDDGSISESVSILVLCLRNELVRQLQVLLGERVGPGRVRRRSGVDVDRDVKLGNMAVERGLVNIAVPLDAKGYDADVVFVVNPDGLPDADKEDEQQEIGKRKSSYVAATRAKSILAVYSSVHGSKASIVADAKWALVELGDHSE